MRSKRRPLFATLGTALVVFAAVGGILEATLLLETHRARKTLLPTLRAVESDAVETTTSALGLVRRRAWSEAAEMLATATEVGPTAGLHAVAAHAARAAGAFEPAARHENLAARLSPGDEARAEASARAIDRALLARFRTPARVLLFLGLAVLVLHGRRRHVRRRRQQALESWLDGIQGEMRVRADGPTWTIDTFLKPQGPHVAPPHPGPTLGLVLSHAGSSRSVRLTPRRDVREDAVRVRVRPETLKHVLALPGRWRIQARLDGRLVAEAPVEVGA